MKWLTLSILIMIMIIFGLFPCDASTAGKTVGEESLKNIDALEAMSLANEWKWTRADIRSYVTAREVIFEFPTKKIYKIPLPEEKMVVAVAPFIKTTHT